MAYDSERMKSALQSRRGKGLDISILVGQPQDDKKTDLAPPASAPLSSGPEGVLSQPDHLMTAHEDALQDADLMHGMSDGDLQDMQGRAPRSLGERARQAMQLKMKK